MLIICLLWHLQHGNDPWVTSIKINMLGIISQDFLLFLCRAFLIKE